MKQKHDVSKARSITAQRLAIVICVATCCITARLNVTAQDGKDEPLPSTVIRVKGAARFTQNEANGWLPLKRGQVLLPSTILQTAKGAQVDLVIGSKLTLPKKQGTNSPAPALVITNGIRLLGDSVLCLKQIEGRQAVSTNAAVVRTVELELRSGGIIGIAGKPVEGGKYGVRIWYGVFTVAEGAYFVEATGDCGALNKAAILSFRNTETKEAKTYDIPAGYWGDGVELKKWENRPAANDPFPASPKQRD